MKVNTDGVLLGAWAASGGTTQSRASTLNHANILDIGTGTGVIALMLAQRFPEAQIDGVEIDKLAATTAAVNFQASHFADRLRAIPLAIEHYFMVYPDKQFDLIVSNPPFFIDDLKSADQAKETARHTNSLFFEDLCNSVSKVLAKNGRFCLILPLNTAEIVQKLAKLANLYVQEIVHIKSFSHSLPHRQIMSFGFQEIPIRESDLIIYEVEKVYSAAYKELLKDF